MFYHVFNFKTFWDKKTLLFLVFLSTILLSFTSVGFAANEWQLQEHSSTAIWKVTSQFDDKLSCAQAAKQAVEERSVFTGIIRCFNSVILETLNWTNIQQVIAASVPAPPPLTPSGQCSAAAPSLWPAGYWATNPPLLPCGVVGEDGTKVDCLQCGVCGFLILGQRIIYLIISFLLFIVAPVRFIWGGFLIMVSLGSPERVSKGWKMIYQTAIGLLIALGAFLIIQTFLWLVGGAGLPERAKLGWPQINCQRELEL
jgi:hypothetical protein